MKLNLGCGNKKMEGYVNADFDSLCQPDMVLDIRKTPWPFAENSITEIMMSHVLEHIGGSADEFRQVIQEIYSVLGPDGVLKVIVPHSSHDAFPADPTHVRPIALETFRLLSKKINDQCRASGDGSSLLGYAWNVDFDLIDRRLEIDSGFAEWAKKNSITVDADSIRFFRNSVRQIYLEVRAVKPVSAG